MGDTQTITRKIQIFPVGDKEEIDRAYKYIRDGMYAQYQASNLLMGQLASEYFKCNRDIKSENFRIAQKEIFKAGNPLMKEISFPTGNDTFSLTNRKVNQDFSIALKNGLARGERTITNYKRTNPLLTNARVLKFYHEYKSYNDFLDKLFEPDLEVFIKWVNKIKFKIVFGNPHKSHELRCVIQNIFEEIYKVQGSSIQFDKTGKKIILNLSLAIPKKRMELDENTVVGVDLGVAIPAVCALNNDEYAREFIGSKDDFLRVRTRIQNQKRRLQKGLKFTTGGHGRNKKLKPLKKFEDYEKNFVQTYSHMVSKRVVDFAVKHNAKYINIEDLEGYRASNFILRNWSYYKLEQYITYKARIYGIEVRKVNPYNTSQICSCCGHWEEGQRIDQSHFKCKLKSCGAELNADFNAAKNIAKSKDFR